MRVIEFKAKCLDNQEWTCGFFYKENGNTYIIEDRQKESMLNRNIPYKVAPATVCQFTGFQDLAGHDIYEGDILVSHTFPFYSYSHSNDKLNPDYVGIVSWNEHLACFELKMRKNYSIQGKDTYGNELREFNKIFAINYEVIGSIHDPKWQEKLIEKNRIIMIDEKKIFKNDIDWEQRRYEIAKEVTNGLLAAPVIEGVDPNPPFIEIAERAVRMADCLIKVLKRKL